MPQENQETTDCGVQREPGWIENLSKDTIFYWSVAFALIVLGIGVYHRLGKVDLSSAEDFLMPMSIPWFGALGAIIISLQAVFERQDDWDPAYNYWHLARPIMGAALGVVSFLMLSVVVALAGSVPNATEAPSVANLNIFHVLAFVVGYREATFRDLLKRSTDLILRPSEPTKE